MNIILGHSEVHATKLFDSQPAIMLINCHKRHIFPLSVLFQATRQANNHNNLKDTQTDRQTERKKRRIEIEKHKQYISVFLFKNTLFFFSFKQKNKFVEYYFSGTLTHVISFNLKNMRD